MSYQKTFCLGRFNSFERDGSNNIVLKYHKNGSDFIQSCFLSHHCTQPLDISPDDLILIERNEQYYVRKKNGTGRYSLPLVMSVTKFKDFDSLKSIFESSFNENLEDNN